jgi:hypothetical protein
MRILTNTGLYLFREYEQEDWGVFSQSDVMCDVHQAAASSRKVNFHYL